jgi:hypothetical protein
LVGSDQLAGGDHAMLSTNGLNDPILRACSRNRIVARQKISLARAWRLLSNDCGEADAVLPRPALGIATARGRHASEGPEKDFVTYF